MTIFFPIYPLGQQTMEFWKWMYEHDKLWAIFKTSRNIVNNLHWCGDQCYLECEP